MEGSSGRNISVTYIDPEKERSQCLLGVPKKGRIYDKCMEMILGAGLEHHRPNRLDVAHCTNLNVTIVFLPAADIATYVAEGNVDAGITGLDCVEESDADVEKILDLEFGRCKLCLQAPITSGYKSAAELSGKRIVTSFPNLARKFFQQYDKPGKPTRIKYVSGSVEAACGLGLADAVVDLVETGTTMKAAGLEVVADVLTTEAVLVASRTSTHRDVVEIIRKRLLGYMTATNFMMIQYNIANCNLSAALKITPGKRAPTVSPLQGEDAVAVSALVKKRDASTVMDQLETTGATDILLFAISNSRM